MNTTQIITRGELTSVYVTISRTAPWAMDASISTRGHESGIRSGKLESDQAAADWIAENAPEFANPNYTMTYRDDPTSHTTCTVARDARGYFSEITVTKFYTESITPDEALGVVNTEVVAEPEVIIIPAGATAELLDGSTALVDQTIIATTDDEATAAPVVTRESLIGTTWTHTFDRTRPQIGIREWYDGSPMVEVYRTDTGAWITRDYPALAVKYITGQWYAQDVIEQPASEDAPVIERCDTCRCRIDPEDMTCPECGAAIPGREWDLVIEPMYPELASPWTVRLVGDELHDAFPWGVVNTVTDYVQERYTHQHTALDHARALNEQRAFDEEWEAAYSFWCD